MITEYGNFILNPMSNDICAILYKTQFLKTNFQFAECKVTQGSNIFRPPRRISSDI